MIHLRRHTTALLFCLQERGQSLRQAVRDYHAKADGIATSTSVPPDHIRPTEQVLGQELPALIKDGYTSFQVFMTYEDLALSDRQTLEVMSVARETARWSWSTSAFDAIVSSPIASSEAAVPLRISTAHPGRLSST